MIACLKGIIRQKHADFAIVEVNGVGYQVIMPATDLAALPAVGEQALVYTHLHLKDDTLQLYAFTSEEKKRLFLNLISVSSIGPRLALAVLSHLSVEQLRQAIISSNVELISSTPGVGKKTAKRLILELKDKLSLSLTEEMLTAVGPLAEAQAALVALGYTPHEAGQALAHVSSAQTTDEYIKKALKSLGAKE